MQVTFESMIPDEKVPKSYDKLALVKSLGSEASVHGKTFFHIAVKVYSGAFSSFI